MPMGNAAVRAPDRLTGEQLHARGVDQTAPPGSAPPLLASHTHSAGDGKVGQDRAGRT